MRSLSAVLVAVALAAAAGPACRTGKPLLGPRSDTTPGTIAGILATSAGEAIAGRRVEAVHSGSSQRYSVVTSVTGGFSIPVPPGKYRLQVELREGEALVRQPGEIEITSSDLDANIELVIGSS